MYTSRTVTFLAAALLLYFFANQTQIGWLYVMSALLAGIVPAAWWLNRRSLDGIAGERRVGEGMHGEVYEGDSLAIHLNICNLRRTAAAHLQVFEQCPLALPDDADREVSAFVPALAAGRSAEIEYEVTAYRRGLHQFPPLKLTSRAPLGCFRRERMLDVPTRVLVYPEIHALRRLTLLDRQPVAQWTQPRAGVGTEVMGIRPFRSGDSPRHVHWRSVARVGRLISKEFADETQPGLTLVLDRYRLPLPWVDSKHTPFEWAVKVAASVADYAQRCGYPLYILADDEDLPPPAGAVRWDGVLQYLARVQPVHRPSLPELLGNPKQIYQNLIAVIIPYPDASVIAPLISLHQCGFGVLAVLIDPASFPMSGDAALPFSGQLRAAGIDTRLIHFGQDWAEQLEEYGEPAKR